MVVYLTCIFSFPNSLFKLWLNARRPNLPAANVLVVLFPRQLAVAPVKISAPRLPTTSSSFALKAVIASLENANAARTFVSSASATSSSVISRNGFQTPYAAL